MTTLTWNLPAAPAQASEFWMLFVDGNALCSLANQAPYVGAGNYSVDLTKLDSNAVLPSDGAPHAYSVALVGGGVVGPLSAAVEVTLPPPAGVTVGPPVASSSPIWPVAGSVASH